MYYTKLTGSSHGSEIPALSVFNWLASVAQELLEDFAAAGPYPWVDTIFKTTFEFAFQETVIVVGVDLKLSPKLTR